MWQEAARADTLQHIRKHLLAPLQRANSLKKGILNLVFCWWHFTRCSMMIPQVMQSLDVALLVVSSDAHCALAMQSRSLAWVGAVWTLQNFTSAKMHRATEMVIKQKFETTDFVLLMLIVLYLPCSQGVWHKLEQFELCKMLPVPKWITWPNWLKFYFTPNVILMSIILWFSYCSLYCTEKTSKFLFSYFQQSHFQLFLQKSLILKKESPRSLFVQLWKGFWILSCTSLCPFTFS